MIRIIALLSVSLIALGLSGCGLVSGTAFVSQEIDGTITTDTQPGSVRGGAGTLDGQMVGALVDLTDNSDWSDFTIEGVEDGCIYVEANNHLTTPVSGELWITMDLDFDPAGDPDAVRNHPGAFMVFSGLAIPPDANGIPGDGDIEKVFTCFETIELLQNTDLLVAAVQNGQFMAWGLGDQDIYCFTFTGIIFGFHITGSV